VSEVWLDGDQIRSYLNEVADTLPAGTRHELLMVGGSLLAWHGLRASTLDVDSVNVVGDEMRDALALVGERHGLASHWLNDRARPFRPATLRDEDCEVLLDHPRLRVLGAPMSQLFLMKLDAARSVDYTDMVTLWPRCGFASAEQAVERYYEAYPNATVDEFLVEFVAGVAAQSATDGDGG
jgi:hypothetical protein